MTEQEIIEAINTIADNHEQGIVTDSAIISDTLRHAITRLYSLAYNKGFGKGYDEAKSTYQSHDDNALHAAIKREEERLEKEYREAYNEKVDTLIDEQREKLNALEKRHEQAAELMKKALEVIELDVYAWP